MTDYWGKFQVAQQDVVDAYSGNAEAGRVTGATGWWWAGFLAAPTAAGFCFFHAIASSH